MEELKNLLLARFAPDPDNPTPIDACIGIQIGEVQVVVRPGVSSLEFVQTKPDFVIYFASLECLSRIMGDMHQALLGFTENRLRSSGYILWTFQTIRMFTPRDSA